MIDLQTASHATIWVCVDCMMIHANGETGELDPSQPEPWSHENAKLSPTMGMMHEEHECGDPREGTCECETQEFSWTPCEGCGSSLGGSRHAFTVWWND